MSAVLNFTSTWKKCYSVLRYGNGFGLYDSLRFGLGWFAAEQALQRSRGVVCH
jgi:hypothetical protein